MRLLPTVHDLAQLLDAHDIVPVSVEVVADGMTPVLAAKTVATGTSSYLLESVVSGEKWSRYSFVGLDAAREITGRPWGVDIVHLDRGERERIEGDPFAILRRLLGRARVPRLPYLPRFWGGAVGYVTYDAVRGIERTARRGADDELWFWFAVGGPLLVFDDYRKTMRVVVPVHADDASRKDPAAAHDRARTLIESTLATLAAATPLPPFEPPERGASVAIPPSSSDRASYRAAVLRAKEHIRAGDIFQVVLSQRFQPRADGVDLFDVYRALRVTNPSPYMFYLRSEHLELAGASPETLVRVEDGVAEVRPIAGTRPRSLDDEKDAALARELLEDEKERSEHVMLVDLGRNDLGRIAEAGSVVLADRMIVERYSHVMHIVSSVRAKVSPDRGPIDVLAATFPAGTLSGAPKVRAMQIIDALEPEPRGVYGGAAGYIGWDGNLDFAIAIRTVARVGDEVRVQAGAGIVEASDPDKEHEECLHKARAALLAVETARKKR